MCKEKSTYRPVDNSVINFPWNSKRIACSRWIFTILSILATTFTCLSQIKLQVVTTRIEKSFLYKPDNAININAEKGDISVANWDKPEVKIVLKLISKHPDKKIAEEELKYMRYIMEQGVNKIDIKNYFAIKKGAAKVTAHLKAEYEIFVPLKAIINITNNYGNISVKNIEGRLTVNNEYGNIMLQNINGKIKLNTYFGDISGELINGSFAAKINHSDIVLNNMQGGCDIDAVYGEVSLGLGKKITSINVKAQNGDVNIESNNFKQFNFKLISLFGDIKLPNGNNYEFSKYTDEEKSIYYESDYNNPLINVKTSFGKIIIK